MARIPSAAVNQRAAGSGREWRPLFVCAGAAAILFVVLLISALALDFAAPPPVDGGAQTLEFIAGHKAAYVAEQILWILPNILAVLVFTALFVAVLPTQKSLSVVVLVAGALPWALFLAVPVSSRGSLNLVYLSDRYMAASTAEGRRIFATAAEAIIAENNTPALIGALSAAGILLMAIAMSRTPSGQFPRWVAWLGMATGALGIASEILRYAVPEFYWGYGVLLWAWFVSTGIALIRMPVPATQHRAPAEA